MLKKIFSQVSELKKIRTLSQNIEDLYYLYNLERLSPQLMSVFDTSNITNNFSLSLTEKIYNSSFFDRYRLRASRQLVDMARQIISLSSSEVEQLFDKALEYSPINDCSVIQDYIIYEFNYGINDSKLEQLLSYHFSTSFKWKNNEKNRLCHAINILLKINDNNITSAKNYLNGYLKEFGHEGLEAIPKVAYFAFQNGIESEYIKYSSYIAGEVMRTQQDKLFSRTINNKKIFIVGNGPNGIGKHHGPKIDQYDYVVRFNKGVNVSQRHRDDYGKKVNIWVRNNAAPYDDYKYLKKIKFCILIDSIERMHWKKDQLKNFYENLLKSKCRLIAPNRKFHQDFFRKYNFSRFTSGILTVNYLLSLLNNHELCQLIGFSSIPENNTIASFYDQKQLSFYSKGNPKENKGFMNHSFTMEKQAMKDILSLHKVKM